MGGWGSGRYWERDDRKGNTGEHLRLDSFYFGKYIPLMRQKNKESLKSSIRWSDGSQIGFTLFLNHIIVGYTIGSEPERANIRDTIYFNSVPNNYGGHDRIYFTCPCCDCRSRCLYLHIGHFKCRKCACLNYTSQQMTKNEMLEARKTITFLQDKFNETSDIWQKIVIGYIPPRPKGMHTKTYEKLLMELFELQKKYAKKRIERVQRQRASMMAAIESSEACMRQCDKLISKLSKDANAPE